ncbi:MAG: NUDIX hydrolase [bacterium]|nr:NUDIX hydrolase [bacterium]
MSKKPFTEEEFKSIYSKVPRLCVEVVIQSQEGILLTLRSLPSWNNQWHLPGGTVLFGEKLEDSVKRVAEDELGASVTVDQMIGIIEYPSEQKERGYGHGIGIAYLCYLNSPDIKLNAEASEAKFFQSAPENIIQEQRYFLKSKKLLE